MGIRFQAGCPGRLIPKFSQVPRPKSFWHCTRESRSYVSVSDAVRRITSELLISVQMWKVLEIPWHGPYRGTTWILTIASRQLFSVLFHFTSSTLLSFRFSLIYFPTGKYFEDLVPSPTSVVYRENVIAYQYVWRYASRHSSWWIRSYRAYCTYSTTLKFTRLLILCCRQTRESRSRSLINSRTVSCLLSSRDTRIYVRSLNTYLQKSQRMPHSVCQLLEMTVATNSCMSSAGRVKMTRDCFSMVIMN